MTCSTIIAHLFFAYMIAVAEYHLAQIIGGIHDITNVNTKNSTLEEQRHCNDAENKSAFH